MRVREWLGHKAAPPFFFSVFGRRSEPESKLYYVTSQHKWIDVPVVRSFGFRSSWKAETARSSVTKVGAIRQQFGIGTNKRRSIKIYNEQSDYPRVHLNYGGTRDRRGSNALRLCSICFIQGVSRSRVRYVSRPVRRSVAKLRARAASGLFRMRPIFL